LGLVWLHNASDVAIWLAYLAIPLVLLIMARRRRDLPFRWLFILFGAFIVSCGFSHFMEALTTHVPLYRLSGMVKAVTALVSWATVLSLIPVIPKALALRSPEELGREVRGRIEAEESLRGANAELERRVRERTDELEQMVASLHDEVENRNQVELLLLESREQLKLVTDNAPVLLVYCDKERRYKFVNRAYAECFALTPRDVVGKHIAEVVGERSYALLRGYVDAALAGEGVEFEVEIPYEGAGRGGCTTPTVRTAPPWGRWRGFWRSSST
jgi:PAS domain-containing protein